MTVFDSARGRTLPADRGRAADPVAGSPHGATAREQARGRKGAAGARPAGTRPPSPARGARGLWRAGGPVGWSRVWSTPQLEWLARAPTLPTGPSAEPSRPRPSLRSASVPRESALPTPGTASRQGPRPPGRARGSGPPPHGRRDGLCRLPPLRRDVSCDHVPPSETCAWLRRRPSDPRLQGEVRPAGRLLSGSLRPRERGAGPSP